jgi:hypothetical protein
MYNLWFSNLTLACVSHVEVQSYFELLFWVLLLEQCRQDRPLWQYFNNLVCVLMICFTGCILRIIIAVQMALCRTYHRYSVDGVAATSDRWEIKQTLLIDLLATANCQLLGGNFTHDELGPFTHTALVFLLSYLFHWEHSKTDILNSGSQFMADAYTHLLWAIHT